MRMRLFGIGAILIAMLVVVGVAQAETAAPSTPPAATTGETATPPAATPPATAPAVPPATPAAEQETKVTLADLPEAVQKTVKEQTKGIKAYDLVKEVVASGGEVFEIKMKVKGLAKEVELDAEGNVVTVEQEVKLTALPKKVKKGLTTAAGKGKITKVQSITKGTAVTYMAQVKTGKATSEVIVDAEGAAVTTEPAAQ